MIRPPIFQDMTKATSNVRVISKFQCFFSEMEEGIERPNSSGG